MVEVWARQKYNRGIIIGSGKKTKDNPKIYQ